MFVPVIFALFATASGAGLRSQCTDIKPVQNFDMSKIVGGVWYENARYPTGWEDQAECTKVKYERDGDAIRFFWSQVFENDHHLRNSTGLMELNSGVITFTSSMYKEGTGSTQLSTSIVDFDYDHYVLFFDCKYDPINDIEEDHAWIITRNTSLDAVAKAKLEEFFAKHNLDVNVLIYDRFGEKDCKVVN